MYIDFDSVWSIAVFTVFGCLSLIGLFVVLRRFLFKDQNLAKFKQARFDQVKITFDFRPKVKPGEAYELKGALYLPGATLPIESAGGLAAYRRIDAKYKFDSGPFSLQDWDFVDKNLLVNLKDGRYLILQTVVQLVKQSTGSDIRNTQYVKIPVYEEVLEGLKDLLQREAWAGSSDGYDFIRRINAVTFRVDGLDFAFKQFCITPR